MIDDRQEELASLHAFDLLEGAEREQFVAELSTNPELRALVAELRAVASGMAHTAPLSEPPEELRARVLASAAARRSAAEPVAFPPALAPRFPSWVPWLMAACLAAAAAWSQREVARSRDEVAALNAQERLVETALDQTRGQLSEAKRQLSESSRQVADLSAKLKDEGDLAHFKIATLASMLGNTPEALAVAVWDPSRQQGVLTVSKLPALASEKDYQLWVIDKQYPNPVNAGVFVVDPVTGEAHIVFKADKHVDSIAKFAVSLERKGGVPKAEGPIVLLSP
jgi:anti-sigma-K factor RskA